VPELSLASVWEGPSLDAAGSKWRSEADVASLVERLAARRTSEEEARTAIMELAASSGDARQEKLLTLLAGLFESINEERSDIVAGIERYGRKQKQLAETLREETAKLDTLRNAADADPSKVAQMSDQFTWSLRVFEERQRSLRYVCEVPVLIEQRLFTLVRMIQSALQ
jgi:chromosome segregation ATPase